jgi:soluble lytic murein transglycosylase-like protein
MRYTSSGAIAALAICLASLQPSHAQVNDETDARAFIVRDAEIQRAKADDGAGEDKAQATAAVPAAAADAKDKRSPVAAAALAAPVGSEGLKALVARHAAANGVPFSLADAVVRIESRYNPRAANAGNYGLMQIRHQTARGMGYAGPAGGLLDPETNARYAMKYLALAYRAAGGDTCRTIMKYQSGHMATRMSGANRTYCAKVRTITARN